MPLKIPYMVSRSLRLRKELHLHPWLTASVLLLLNTSTANGQSLGISAPEFGASLELNLQRAEAQDADFINDRDTALAEIELTLDVKQPFGDLAELVGRLQLSSRSFTRDERNNSDERFAYDLERLFLEVNPHDNLRFRLGRQAFDDPMEFIWDEELDGIRLSFDIGDIELELSQTREDGFEASTLDRVDEIDNTYAAVTISPNKNTSWTPYVIYRTGDELGNSPQIDNTWIGLQAIVQPKNSSWRYWLHATAMDGTETEAGTEINLEGRAYQLGINWTANRAWKPTLTFAFSHATGGERDERFRQTGLHGNDFALNDKSTFRYFGEVLDPELTNIRILTVGIGAEITKKWTADVAVHSYQQVELEDNLRGSDIDFEPLGLNDDLGIGADLIVNYEYGKQLNLLMTAGRFVPGDAFSEGRDDAWIARLEVEFKF